MTTTTNDTPKATRIRKPRASRNASDLATPMRGPKPTTYSTLCADADSMFALLDRADSPHFNLKPFQVTLTLDGAVAHRFFVLAKNRKAAEQAMVSNHVSVFKVKRGNVNDALAAVQSLTPAQRAELDKRLADPTPS